MKPIDDLIKMSDGTRWRPVPRPDEDGCWDFAPADAARVARILRKFVDRRVLLFGGGGPGAWACTLRRVRVKRDKKTSRVALRVLVAGRQLPMPQPRFEPLLASWWIALRERSG